MMRAYMLYTGPDGHTHMQKGAVDTSQLIPAESVQFKIDPPHSSSAAHNAPSSQFVLSLTGVVEVTMQPGQQFIVRPGEVMIATDQEGSGHSWKLVNEEPWTRAYVVFEAGTNIRFRPDEG